MHSVSLYTLTESELQIFTLRLSGVEYNSSFIQVNFAINMHWNNANTHSLIIFTIDCSFERGHLQRIAFLSSSAEITRHVNEATFINLPASSSSRTLLSCLIYFLRLGLVSETTSQPLKATKERRDSISLTGIRSTT